MERLSQTILLLTGWRRTLLAMAAGALTVLALAPFHLFVIGFFTFPVLVWLLDGATGKAEQGRLRRLVPAFGIGWSFGFGYFVAGLWWIANALLVEAPEFAWAIPLAVFGLPAFLAIFFGFATAMARAFWSEGLGRVLMVSASFGVMEWLREFVLTGFPWNALGYALAPTPVMMQAVSVTGFAAFTTLAVLAFCLPASFAAKRASVIVAAGLLVVIVGGQAGYGFWRLSSADQAAEGPVVRIVQPAIDQSAKWQADEAKAIFDRMLNLSELPGAAGGQHPQIIVWPETAIPFILTREPAAVAAIADRLTLGQTLLTGAVREEDADTSSDSGARFYNSILVIDSEGVITGAADKTHLVPFGEYLPFSAFLSQMGLKAVAAADRGYSAAPTRQNIALPGGLNALALICYEAIFPQEVMAEAGAASLMINVTNDAWYGNTPGPYQHAHQARLRSVETGLPMVRAANNGISAVYDGYGRALARIALDQVGVADVSLPGRVEIPQLPVSREIIFWLIILFNTTIGILAWSRRRS